MAFVLDASVALAWLFPDEGNEDAERLIDRLEEAAAVVPAIWPLEVGNALLVALRRGRIKKADMAQLTAALSGLPIEIDADFGAGRISDVLDLASQLNLTTYDAAYVELARRRQIPLATLDERLRLACRELQVVSLP